MTNTPVRQRQRYTRKQLVGMVLALIVLVGMFFVPTNEMLTYAGRNTLGLLVATVVLLICQSINLGILSVLLIPLFYFLGIAETAGDALAGFSNTTTFFILASFGITAAITKTSLAKRMMRWIIVTFGKTTTTVLLAMMLTAGVVSSFMSNLPVCVAFLPLALKFVDVFPEGPERGQAAKAFLIGIPIASMAGGILTPAGAAINVMVMERLQSAAGINVSFLAWIVACAPVGLLTILVAVFVLMRTFKPVQLNREKTEEYLASLDVEAKMSRDEWYTMGVIALMFVFWIASTWYPFFNTTIVAMSGLFLFLCPRIGVMDFADFCGEVNWTMFMLFGAMTTMSSLLSKNGVVAWIVSIVGQAELDGLNPFVVVGGICVVCYILLCVMPIGPTLANQLSVPLIAIALGAGVHPVLVSVPLVITSVNNYLLPLDTLPLMAYNYGYYTAGEQVRATKWVVLTVIVLTTLWLPVVNLMGLW